MKALSSLVSISVVDIDIKTPPGAVYRYYLVIFVQLSPKNLRGSDFPCNPFVESTTRTTTRVKQDLKSRFTAVDSFSDEFLFAPGAESN